MITQQQALIETALAAQRAIYVALQTLQMPEWLMLDLSMAQVKALFVLHTQGAITIGQLARTLKIAKPAASILVERLVQCGFVERHEDADDRRRTLIQLSATSIDLVERLRQCQQEQMRAWLADLTVRDLKALIQGTQALVAIATAQEGQENAQQPEGSSLCSAQS